VNAEVRRRRYQRCVRENAEAREEHMRERRGAEERILEVHA
jgi:hypothetical protein